MNDTLLQLRLDEVGLRYADLESNPNKMEDDKFDLLTAMIKEEGFLQPVLVTRTATGYRIEDGHHRYWAAKRAGLETITGVLLDEANAQRSMLVGLGMNRLRGELELNSAADIIQEVQAILNLPMEEVAVLSGFTVSELDALLATHLDSGDDILANAGKDIHGDDDENRPPAIYTLEIPFEDVDTFRLAKRKLKKMGKGNLCAGLMTALGEED
jgi:ParB-like chromosome segregation protein Spo0J